MRVGCQNTLNLALGGGKKARAIWHTPRLHARLHHEQLGKLTDLEKTAEAVFSEAQHAFDAMAARTMAETETEDYLEKLFPRAARQRREHFEPLRWHRVRLVLEDDNVTPPRTRDTLWGLYNAVVREEDFRATRERNADARLNRVWFGRGSDLKLKALLEARKLIAEPSRN